MGKGKHKLKPAQCLTVIVCIFVPFAGAASGSTTSAPLVIELQDSRPVPKNLVPALVNADGMSGFSGEILPSTSGEDPGQWSGLLKFMRPVSGHVYVTTAPVDRQNLWLLIDHPGYLRGYGVRVPEAPDETTTVVLQIPKRGQLIARMDLDPLRRDAATTQRWNEALLNYCIGAGIRNQKPFYYEISYDHALQDWKFQVDDLAPGDYQLHGGARWCDATSGPAGYGVETEFSIKGGFSTDFTFSMVPRGESSEDKEPPKITFRPLPDK